MHKKLVYGLNNKYHLIDMKTGIHIKNI